MENPETESREEEIISKNNLDLKNPMVFATVTIAIATVLNLLATIYIGWTTSDYVEATHEYVKVSKNTYKVANRPYVSVISVEDNRNVVVDNHDPQNKKIPIVTSKDMREKGILVRFPFSISFKNYGQFPAKDIYVTYKVLVDGEEQLLDTPKVSKKIDEKPVALFPSEVHTRFDSVTPVKSASLTEGTSDLKIEIIIKYKDNDGKEYKTEETVIYYDGQYGVIHSDFD